MNTKKIIVLIIATILLLTAGTVAALTYIGGEKGGYKRSITQSMNISNGTMQQWKFETDKDMTVRVKVRIDGVNIQNNPDSLLLVKGMNSARSKKITAEEMKKKKTVSLTLSCKKGQSNYVLLEPIGCTNVQVQVTLSTHSLKGHLRSGNMNEGKDYGVK